MVLFKRGKAGLRDSISQIRGELDEHLSSINENTGEIHSNYAYIQKLGAKIDRLVDRLNRIEMLLEGNPKRHSITPLTHAEKQVFLALYMDDSPLTYPDLSKNTGYPESLVKHHLTCLIEKGIPIIKSYFNNTPFLKLNPAFKEIQAKENIINLSLKSFVDS